MGSLMKKETRDSRKHESAHQEEFVEIEDAAIYHTDYHGVTTHPTPTPKKHYRP